MNEPRADRTAGGVVKASLAHLRKTQSTLEWAKHEEVQAFLQEAERLFGGQNVVLKD